MVLLSFFFLVILSALFMSRTIIVWIAIASALALALALAAAAAAGA